MRLKVENGDYVRTSGGTLEEIDGAAALFQRAAVCILAEFGEFDYGKRLGSPLFRLSEHAGDETRRALAMAQKAVRWLPEVRVKSAAIDKNTCTFTLSIGEEEQTLEVTL